jgi:hypothetical protein
MSRDHQTAIFGTGAGLVTKYNINATAGAGRWHSLEQIPMEAPIEGIKNIRISLIIFFHGRVYRITA